MSDLRSEVPWRYMVMFDISLFRERQLDREYPGWLTPSSELKAQDLFLEMTSFRSALMDPGIKRAIGLK